MCNSEIVLKLKELGMKIDECRLGEIFVNFYYCGVIVLKFIVGKVVVGNYELMIFCDIFLKVNNVIVNVRV